MVLIDDLTIDHNMCGGLKEWDVLYGQCGLMERSSVQPASFDLLRIIVAGWLRSQ